MKIYIHHYYNKSIFYKLAHNTTNRIFNIKDNNEGSIFCEYNNVKLEFIFKQDISFEEDGIHILDYFSAFSYGRTTQKLALFYPIEIIWKGKASKF